mgnify:CR=1 FL=1
MQKIVPVSKKNHQKSFFYKIEGLNSNFENFRSMSNCPIVIDEVKSVAGEFPIVFKKNSENRFYLSCIFSLLKDVNPFVNQEKHWNGGYIPVFFRVHPFLLAYSENKKDKVLCFLQDSTSISNKKGQGFHSFFDKELNLSKELSSTFKLLQLVEENKIITQKALDSLDKFKILQEWPIEIKADDSKSENIRIEGWHKIDEKKLKSLSSNDLKILNQNRSLEIAYSQLISIPKLNHIVNLHTDARNIENSTKSLRDRTIDKQKKEKKLELDELVQNLFDID